MTDRLQGDREFVTTRRVRCPSAPCRAIFVVGAERLGRTIHCPECGVRMTARPLEVELRLARQQSRIAGEPGASIERLPFKIIVDNVRSLWNVGSIFRTADGCGVREILLTGISGLPPRPGIAKTALGAERAVAWRYLADPLEALRAVRDEGYLPVALENGAGATDLDALEWPPRVCLVVGNEVAGISPGVLAACEQRVAIPMLGVKDSFNVAVAFGIAAHRASRVLWRRCGREA